MIWYVIFPKIILNLILINHNWFSIINDIQSNVCLTNYYVIDEKSFIVSFLKYHISMVIKNLFNLISTSIFPEELSVLVLGVLINVLAVLMDKKNDGKVDEGKHYKACDDNSSSPIKCRCCLANIWFTETLSSKKKIIINKVKVNFETLIEEDIGDDDQKMIYKKLT